MCASRISRFVGSSTLPKNSVEVILGTSMTYKRSRRKPDLFSLLLIVVVVGMAVTLGYQINVYYGGDAVPIAKQAPTASGVGG
jgi:cytochrome bd-type quinol oxidase subunit 2